MSTGQSPKELGKKYTPKADSGSTGSSSSGPFSKTTPIFAKRNPISSIQQTALASQQPAEIPPTAPPAEGSIPAAAVTPAPDALPETPLAPPTPPAPALPKLGMLSVEPPSLPTPQPSPAVEALAYPQPIAPAAAPAPQLFVPQPPAPQPYSHAHPAPHLQQKHPEAIPSIPIAHEKKHEENKPVYIVASSSEISFAPDEKSILATAKDLNYQVVIPAGTELEGTYKTDRSLVIQGRVGGTGKNLGNLYTSGLIYVSKTARVEANIQCSRLEIYGSVDGEIIAREEVLLHKGGKLQGKVQTPHFKTEPGSFFKGTMEMTGAESSVAATSAPPPLR